MVSLTRCEASDGCRDDGDNGGGAQNLCGKHRACVGGLVNEKLLYLRSDL